MTSHSLAAAALVGVLIVSACETQVQTTSGADYLAGYDRYEAGFSGEAGTPSDVDADVRQIAAIEPQLQFPARIGLARIEFGRLQAIPADEGLIWQDLAEEIGPEFGNFVPVSPLIAEMVSEPHDETKSPAANVIADVRRGAARQHLDYVMVYEVGSARQERANELALADLSIIGMFVLPTRGVAVDASASALLLDVRNGYPYASLTGHAEETGSARVISTGSRTAKLRGKAETRAVAALAEQAREAFEGLAEAAAEAP